MKNSITFTTELKSPHAYVEFLASREAGHKMVQLMGCDIDDLSLPNPIVGDLFIPNCHGKLKILKKVWKDQSGKIFYPGFCSLEMKKKNYYKYSFCYFSSYHKPTINIEVLELLNIFSKKMKVKCLVKLHPRDSLVNYEKYNLGSLDFISSGLNQAELFSEFKYAIVGESAICFDLLQAKIPFIFLGDYTSHPHSSNKYPSRKLSTLNYIDDKFKSIATDIKSLKSLLNQPRKIEDESKELYQRLVVLNDKSISSFELVQSTIQQLDSMHKIQKTNVKS